MDAFVDMRKEQLRRERKGKGKGRGKGKAGAAQASAGGMSGFVSASTSASSSNDAKRRKLAEVKNQELEGYDSDEEVSMEDSAG